MRSSKFQKIFKNFNKKNSHSFTLIEILITISIITILSGFIIVNNISSRAWARDRKRMEDLAAYQTALHEYYAKWKYYPNPHTDELADVALAVLESEDFLVPLPVDPINDIKDATDYRYRYTSTDGKEYKLYVPLERDTIAMERDGGTCPPAAGCPMGVTALYEVFSKMGSLIAIFYPTPGITQFLSCDIIERLPADPDAETTCTNADGVPVLRVSNSGDDTTGGAHAELVSELGFTGNPYCICCWGPPDLGASCDPTSNRERFLNLQSSAASPVTNAHVQEVSGVLKTWKFRKPIRIDNNTGVRLRDYQVGIDITDAIYDETGLKGSWHMNEDSWNGTENEVVDSSDQENHGTAIGGATTIPGGKFGRAGSFDGVDDYVNVSHSDSLNITDAVTLEAWINPPAAPEFLWLTILNVHSATKAGENWVVSFETEGTADLTISPQDLATINDLDFISLFCNGEDRTPGAVVGPGDVISYSNWSCDGKGEITHLVNQEGSHTLEFNFGGKIRYAYDSPPVWVSPTGFEDPSGLWADEPKAYDDNLGTYARNVGSGSGYRGFIVLTLPEAINCDKIRVNADYLDTHIDHVDIDILYEGAASFTDIYQGPLPDCEWEEISFPAGSVTKARFRYNYTATGASWSFWVYEFDFHRAPAAVNLPAADTLDATSIEENSAILHGAVKDDGGEPCEFRFQYGKTKAYGTNTPWEDSRAIGETFSRFISGLDNGTTYHFRAQVRNSAGTASGPDKTFYTGPIGVGWVSPTGYNDPDNKWENEMKSYDDDILTPARNGRIVGDGVWSSYFYLTRPEIPCDKIRFYARGLPEVDLVYIEVLKDGAWTPITASGGDSFTDKSWVEKSFTKGSVIQARIKFHAKYSNHYFYYELYEFDFYKAEAPPVKRRIVGKGKDAYELQIDENLWVTGFINTTQSVTTQITEGWHHVVLTFDKNLASGNLKLYVDGEFKDSLNYSSPINTNIKDLVIGKKFVGFIDEVKIYSRALSGPTIDCAAEPDNDICKHYEAEKARLDYADIRFTDSDGLTPLSYFQESDKKFWVKVPHLPAVKIIYMYYGYPEATSQSDGDATFDFFDEFEDNTNNWTVKSGTGSIHDGVLDYNGGGCQYVVEQAKTVSAPAILESRLRFSSTPGPNAGFDWPMVNVAAWGADECGGTSGDWYLFAGESNGNARLWEKEGTIYTNLVSVAHPTSTNTWYRWKNVYAGSDSGYLAYLRGDVLIWEHTDASPRPNGPGYIAWREGDVEIDWTRVRKYADPEPDTTMLGEESVFELPTYACISASPARTISCEYKASCDPATETTVCSISNFTNAHIGNANKYDLKVCCKITL